MVLKCVLVLCVSMTLANAGLTAIAPVATYSAAPSVSYSTFTSPVHTNAISYAAHPAAIATHTTTYAAHAAPAALTTTYSAPAIGSTHQSNVRSFGGTISHHSKAVDTAFSSVRQSDTRKSNNVYTPALAATTYAAAAPVYHSASVVAAAPSATIYAAQKTLTYSAAPLVAHVSFEGLGTHYAF